MNSTGKLLIEADEIKEDGPIEENKSDELIRKEPLPLPKDFEWCNPDITDETQLREVYELLTANYVEDDAAVFRFDYSAAFLNWALKAPGWTTDWHLGVRVKASKKLVGFITGIPANLFIHQTELRMAEINFLCVHKKLRSKRLAPVLIKEITRRINLTGIFQAVYTAGVYLPKPFSSCRYYHRSLNPKKLIETGFSALQRDMTMPKTIRLYKLPEKPLLEGFRKMEESDVTQATLLLSQYLQKLDIAPNFSEDEFKHWLLPVKDVVYSYVVEVCFFLLLLLV